MFGFIKQPFIVLLSFSGSLATKYDTSYKKATNYNKGNYELM